MPKQCEHGLSLRECFTCASPKRGAHPKMTRKEKTMTLLERWDDSHTETMRWKPEEIRRAIAIAQAVDEFWTGKIGVDRKVWLSLINRRAEELLEGK